MSQPAQRRGRRRLDLADRYYERGLYQFEKNKLDLAIADLDEAIDLEPKRAEFYVARGLMLVQNGQMEEAEEDFAEGLRLDSTQWLAHYGRGVRAFEEADFAAAIDHFSRAQYIAPDRPEIYYYRAIALNLNGDSDEAIRDMEYAQSLLDSEDKRQRDTTRWINIFKK
jgi:Flp pilus assembly protein TadD